MTENKMSLDEALRELGIKKEQFDSIEKSMNPPKEEKKKAEGEEDEEDDELKKAKAVIAKYEAKKNKVEKSENTDLLKSFEAQKLHNTKVLDLLSKSVEQSEGLKTENNELKKSLTNLTERLDKIEDTATPLKSTKSAAVIKKSEDNGLTELTQISAINNRDSIIKSLEVEMEARGVDVASEDPIVKSLCNFEATGDMGEYGKRFFNKNGYEIV